MLVRRKQARGNRLDQKLWPVDWVKYDQLPRIVLGGENDWCDSARAMSCEGIRADMRRFRVGESFCHYLTQ